MPWELILDYMYRPKQLDPGTFDDRKRLLLLYALELRETGKKLDEERAVAMNARGFEGYKMRTTFLRSLR